MNCVRVWSRSYSLFYEGWEWFHTLRIQNSIIYFSFPWTPKCQYAHTLQRCVGLVTIQSCFLFALSQPLIDGLTSQSDQWKHDLFSLRICSGAASQQHLSHSLRSHPSWRCARVCAALGCSLFHLFVCVCSLWAHPEVEDKEAHQYQTEPTAAKDQCPTSCQAQDRHSG